MPINRDYSRIWFETIDAGKHNISDNGDALETAASAIMIEVNAGRMQLDVKRAIIAELRRVDKAHGRAADGLLRRLAAGDTPLDYEDLELVVTLGGGRRKTWFYVTADDLLTMNEIRYRNFKSARESFQEFNANVLAVQKVVSDHGTVGAAFEAGAFAKEEAVA